MARNRSVLIQWGEYLLVRLAFMGLTIGEVELNLRTAAVIGRILYRFDRRHRQRACDHLRIAFPDLSGRQIDDLARQSFEHFLQLVVEICHMPRLIHADSWAKRLRLTDLTPAVELFNSGKPAIMVTGHLGNWEVLGYLMGVLGLRLHAIFRPLDNAMLNTWLRHIREKRGLHIIPKWGATDQALDVLGSGGILGFIADQNASQRDVFVPFFGRLASTYKSIGLLAMNCNVPIVCGYARRVDESYRYELGATDIIYPHQWQTQRDPLYYITARYMHAIETMIAKCPQQYLWMHRRWKTRPRWERLGKPMPPALRRNLEELPWVTPATLERLTDTQAPAPRKDARFP